MNWPANVDWQSPAGKLLWELSQIIPADRRTPILLFGSAALQITVAPTVLSVDADIAPDIIPFGSDQKDFPKAYDRVGLNKLIQDHKLGIHQRPLYIQVNAFEAFDPGSSWGRRSMTVECGIYASPSHTPSIS